jgi:leader peptidase (prepilin peptidase)/N-methyltransferase
MEFIFNYLTEHPILAVIIIGAFSLSIGSFLNVLIYRLPLMLKHAWQTECLAFLQSEQEFILPSQRDFNLFSPRSHCPHCHKAIKVTANIPLLSYFLLKGQCAHCKHDLSLRYPLVELVTLVLSLVIMFHYGLTLPMLAALLFTWSLIGLTFIDIEQQLLPDIITLPLLWLGLFLSVFDIFIPAKTAIIGALAGYLALWSLAFIFKKLTGKVGMGEGDFKLLAAIGAWLGWQALPWVLLLSSSLGAVIGLLLILVKDHPRTVPIPFGPFLAIAAWITLVFGNTIFSF